MFICKIASLWCKYTNYYSISWVEIWFVVSISVHSGSEFNKRNFFRSFLSSKWHEWLYTFAVRNFHFPHFSAWYSREFIRSPRAFWPLKTSKLRDSVKEDLLMLFSRWKWAVIIRAVRNYERYYYIIRVLWNSFPLSFRNLYKKNWNIEEYYKLNVRKTLKKNTLNNDFHLYFI